MAKRKRKIQKRLKKRHWDNQPKPMLTACNIHYEVAGKANGVACGGIGVVHKLAVNSGLVEAINENLHLLKAHLPYHESDHILNMAYNILCGGTCLEDIELLRNNEVYMDALGADRIPDPTTAGDFCRRFTEQDIITLMDAINDIRVRIWSRQPKEFFEAATIDADGVLAATTGECKESYSGRLPFSLPVPRPPSAAGTPILSAILTV